MRPYTVALTGGIASGKSSVAHWFAQQGIFCIDADAMARQVVAPEQQGFKAIVARFGKSILTEAGQINRQLFRSIIFTDSTQKAWLEACLHPLIHHAMQDALAQATTPYTIAQIPLLQETGKPDYVDRVLVVDCPVEIQLARLLARDGIDESLAWAMIQQQASREARLAIADDVLDNQLALTAQATQARLMQLHQQYLAAARRTG